MFVEGMPLEEGRIRCVGWSYWGVFNSLVTCQNLLARLVALPHEVNLDSANPKSNLEIYSIMPCLGSCFAS